MSREYNKEYYKKNKEKWKVYNQDRKLHNKLAKESYHRNSVDISVRKAKWIENNFAYALWQQAKTRAKKMGIIFSLEKEDIIIPEKCPYLDVYLTSTQGKGKVWTNASIDRIDSSKGYTKENIQIISNLANTMKNAATIEQLITFSKNAIKRHATSIPSSI